MTRLRRVDLTACVTGLKEHQAEHLCTELLYTVRQADREVLFGVIMVLSMSKFWWDDPLYLNGFVVDYIGCSGRKIAKKDMGSPCSGKVVAAELFFLSFQVSSHDLSMERWSHDNRWLSTDSRLMAVTSVWCWHMILSLCLGLTRGGILIIHSLYLSASRTSCISFSPSSSSLMRCSAPRRRVLTTDLLCCGWNVKIKMLVYSMWS